MELAGRLGPELELLLPELDERSRRLVLGAVARAAGDGGIAAVARVSGASWQTVANGAAELESGTAAGGRVRRPGGGRKMLAEADPGLVPALLALVDDSTRGDPESPLTWTTKSVRNLAGELGRQGHRASPDTVARLLRARGFSLQANAKTIEGRRHPDRDAQFRYVSGQARQFMAAGQPVISVDAKKKEQVGNYAQPGREWRPAGEPAPVRDHDFPGRDADAGKVTPYGIYDVAANAGFVNVGTDHDTAAFAIESIRCWWDTLGQDAYPGASRLLITADAGGSNGYRTRAWKAGLARLAAQTGLEITVCHFPPGTSKWNKIEHMLFSQISRNWRARPLTSHEVILKTIAAVTTATGLTVTARLDTASYPDGIKIPAAEITALEDGPLTRHVWHGDWNYTMHPAPAPRPQDTPPPRPAPAGRCDQATLAHPALTGLPPGDLAATVAALEIPFAARREQRLYTRRRGPRRNAEGAAPPRKIDLADHVLATRLYYHLTLPQTVIGALLGTDHSTISHAIKLTRALLGPRHPLTTTPPAARIRTLDALRSHAAAAGITIPAHLTTRPLYSTLPAPGPAGAAPP
jgi:hypothetical protein